MPVEIDSMEDHKVCKFSGGLTIWEAADLWQQIRPLLDASDPLVIDLAAVNACDVAGLQMLCRLRCSMKDTDRSIRVEGMPQAVAAAAQLAGMDPTSSFNLCEEV